MTDQLKLHKINLYEEVFSKGESMGNTTARLEFMGVNNITQERLRNSFREFIDNGNRISNKEFFTEYFPQIVWVSKHIERRKLKGLSKILSEIEHDIGCKCFFTPLMSIYYEEGGMDTPEKISLEIHCKDEDQSAEFSFYWDRYKEQLQGNV